MSQSAEDLSGLTPLQRAVLALQKARAKIDALTHAKKEPIAIIGMSCRMPCGADTLEAFWRFLRDGTDGMREVPRGRWDVDSLYDPDPDAPGKIYTRFGAFMEGIDLFDAAFFGISPREAASMDPQQRLLLELSWEALEDAGQPASRFAASRTGVFVGISSRDYVERLPADPAQIDAYVGTGNLPSVAAGRISYVLGLQGPCFPVDTACSSSLVALHLAAQSLRAGECSMALVGGVNAILTPTNSIYFCRLKALAPDGHCKTFDAAADGYSRGEGAAVLVLKRLSDAERDGDRILAVLRGSAVNHDGRSNGLTAPNGPAQEEVLRQALASGDLRPAQVAYVEAHGTGTPLGDPIEIGALAKVFGEGRGPDRPLLVGSLKTNIGHLEAAAGIAGVLKVVLGLQHGEIPPHLHFTRPSPYIAWSDIAVKVTSEGVSWPQGYERRLAGVSSFGLSGTNAHAIFEEAPAGPEEPASPAALPALRPLLISAKSPESLRATARAHAVHLSSSGVRDSFEDICFTAAVRRTHHAHRAAVLATSKEQASRSLAAFASGAPDPSVFSGVVDHERDGKLVFVFPGQGAQWVGMGRDLVHEEPSFRAELERCDGAMRPYLGWSLVDAITAGIDEARMEDVAVVQPVLFAISVSLAALWRSWGVEPDAVVGQSMGEVAAAYVAGALDLEAAAKVICVRSALLRRIAGGGGMAVVELSLTQAQVAIAPYTPQLSIAVSSSPRSTVVSGDTDALAALLEDLTRQHVFCRPVKVSYASHSAQMDPLRDELLAGLADLRPRVGEVPIYSSLTDAITDGADLDAVYWTRNLREPVLFASAVRRLREDGHASFLEISPHPVVLPAIEDGLRALGKPGLVLPSLRRDRDTREVLTGTLCALHCDGRAVNVRGVLPRGRCVQLPAYPWQRERFWADLPAPPGPERTQLSPPQADGQSISSAHPLLGHSLASSTHLGTYFWECILSPDHVPYLAEHRVQGAIVLPGAAYVEMALSAALQAFPGTYGLDRIAFKQVLVLPEGQARVVQIVLSEQGEGRATFQITSREPHTRGSGGWTVHATGALCASDGRTPEDPVTLAEIRARCGFVLQTEAFYRRLDASGLSYGPSFQGVKEIFHRPGEALGKVQLSPEHLAESAAYILHPALLDACFQLLGATLAAGEATSPATFVPVGIQRLRIHRHPGTTLWAHARLRTDLDGRDGLLEGDIILRDDSGELAVEVLGLQSKRLDGPPRLDTSALDGCFHELAWHDMAPPPPAAAAPGGWIILGHGHGLGGALHALLTREGSFCVRAVLEEDTHARASDVPCLDPSRPEAFRTFLQQHFGSARPCAGIVYVAGLDIADPMDTIPAAPQAVEPLGCHGVLSLVQALARMGWRDMPRLCVITRGAQQVDRGVSPVAIAQAPLWGFGRALMHEHPELRCKLIDLDPSTSEEDAAALLAELCGGGGEDQVALRAGGRHVARLVRRRVEAAHPTRQDTFTLSSGRPYRLALPTPGMIDRLELRQATRRAPGPGEVEIQVEAAGLNFLDVLTALGVMPSEGGEPSERPLGGECAGRIVALGAGVSGLHEGDEVVAIATGSFASHVLADSRLVVPKPPGMSFDEAAAVPVAMLTAYHALASVAQLAKGERVLIHAGAGGVGLAAIQWALHVGAEVIATAGNEEKRALLRSLGVAHVADSRSSGFADDIRTWTRGEGVDVVLNSLSGEFIAQSLDLLREGGRFVEIGKRDYHENRALGLRPFLRGLSFSLVDLRGMTARQPDRVRALLQEVFGLIQRGVLSPIPHQSVRIAAAADAYRRMAQGKHVGKLVLSMGSAGASHSGDAPLIRSDATYLITGGLGGLGFAAGAWLVEQGARHLALVSRGGPSAAMREAISALERTGAQIMVAQADVADRAQLASVMRNVEQTMPPLRGVLHAAGVLEDGTLLQLEAEQLRRVMAPKVQGAWNLHTLTSDAPLDLFVLYSSAASLLGSPGQSGYCAANAFLDALAHHRRAHGKPALAINWGAFSQVGLAAAQENRGERLARRGVGSFTPEEGSRALGLLLRDGATQAAVLRLDIRRWRQLFPRVANAPILARLLEEQEHAEPEKGTLNRAREEILAAVSDATRQDLLEAYLTRELADVLRLDRSRIGANARLGSLGLDSLMAIELRNRVEIGLCLSLSVTMIWNFPTVAALAKHLRERLGDAPAAPVSAAAIDALRAGDEVDDEQIGQMSKDELMAFFDSSLGRIEEDLTGE
ncbi:type I polyketide synthase [Chondromyces apiculatus]|uniref:type I polyketide synthase n=1 Tax=Chondromyces apiculatus TaxID=51 RepID=UPI000694C0B5|nr:type I polyketide synthase [Chondromyces apiculatus]